MKRFLGVAISLILILLLTGCGNVDGRSTIYCVSEAIGENPSTVYHEKYVVEDNKVTEFEKYSVISYSDEYLKKISLDDVAEIYSKNGSYDVSKLSDNELKLIYKEPINVFENSQSDNLVELILSTMEENDFALYPYTCEVE